MAQSIARLTNPDLKHRTAQISTDGSRKIKQRLLEPVRSALEAGIACEGLLLGVAGWMQHATGMDHRGQPVELDDPIAERTRDIGRQAGHDAVAIVRGMLFLDDVSARISSSGPPWSAFSSASWRSSCKNPHARWFGISSPHALYETRAPRFVGG